MTRIVITVTLTVLATLPENLRAQPTASTAEVQIHRLLGVKQGTFRIAKDPRDNALYLLRQNGIIDRVIIPKDEVSLNRRAKIEQIYSASDHKSSGTTGFAIGPDGSFYISANRNGPADGGIGPIARGEVVNVDTGERTWSLIDVDSAPENTPLEQILAANTLALDKTTNTRYVVKRNGDITLAPSGTVYTANDHGLSSASGLFIDEQGVFYVFTKLDYSNHNIATITKGQTDPQTGELSWFTLAETDPIELCDCIFNHKVNGLAVSPDNRSLFVNSGSRTDHGEIQSTNNRFPNLREADLTAIVLRLPTDSRNLRIPNDRNALLDQGLLFAEGLRNAYDLAFAPNGELFGTENGPDRDMAEELNWLRSGHHYGFPWRMGLENNPQQYKDYKPAIDLLLPASFNAVRNGYYRNDPDFPPPPQTFTDPVINIGPDANSYRDPADGLVKDAGNEGVPFGTFTSHRSPLGLVFDTVNATRKPYTGDGFVLSWTEGDPNGDNVNGPFKDASEDLLHLELQKVGDNYQAQTTRIVGGFSNPIDAAMIENKIYVLEWSGGRGLWEITLPKANENTSVAETEQATPLGFSLGQNYPNPFNGQTNIEVTLERASNIIVRIYSNTGQHVRTLVNAHLAAGRYTLVWDGRDDNGYKAASGNFHYQLEVGKYSKTRQLTLLK
ncbi:MAG: FlgD immunoglobulin-like domain containing protein [Candidatus Latescibacterota bacterium]|nr:FlgD immunoglobulin-like domain containing protein [Candidatus Latescibacterota bacterium]